MPEFQLDRRELIAASAAIAASVFMATPALAQGVAAAPAYAPQPVPLPFDPRSIPGLSEKLLVSHHDNNYAGAVKRVGAISTQLASIDPATAPSFVVNGLKREELIATNSMLLHEAYFTSLGAPNRPGARLAAAIEHGFGSDGRWRAEFSGMGKALGGGSGWVILAWNPRDGRLVNQWAADHTMALAGATPLMVLDMFEHAYAMDYGAKAAAYVDAVMAALNWSAADARFARATRT